MLEFREIQSVGSIWYFPALEAVVVHFRFLLSQ